jgi:uncharacterized membrane protein (DUF2068 family)
MQNYSNNIQPSYYASSPPPPVQKKERGSLFTFVLIIATGWNILSTFGIVLGGAYADKATQSADDLGTVGVHHVVSRLVALLAAFQIVQLISVFGMWAWKRWAVFGYFATSLLAMVAVFKLGGELSYWSLAWLGVVFFCVFTRMSMFED